MKYAFPVSVNSSREKLTVDTHIVHRYMSSSGAGLQEWSRNCVYSPYLILPSAQCSVCFHGEQSIINTN
jgi:hypothetical protein